MTCDKSLLPHLAVDFDTDIVGLDEDEIRNLLQNSRAIKRYIGSKYAVRKAAESIFGKSAKAIPFYEYEGVPGRYKIEVDVTEEKVVTQENLLKTKKVVEDANRESCMFEGFVITMKIQNQANYKIASMLSESATILPRRIENIVFAVQQKTLKIATGVVGEVHYNTQMLDGYTQTVKGMQKISIGGVGETSYYAQFIENGGV